jgi:predicted ATP-dependent serine protease
MARSRQAAWQAKQRAAGNCRQCGKPRNKYTTRCDDCQRQNTDYLRERRNKVDKTTTT